MEKLQKLTTTVFDNRRKIQQTQGGERESDFQKAHKETGKHDSFKGIKRETAPEEAQIAYLLDNDLRINVLNMLQELKENLDKELEGTRKTKDKRERNCKKESNRNCGAKSTKAEMKNTLEDSRTDSRKNQ